MEYVYPITIQPNTAETSPTRLNVKLNIGTLVNVEVYFPWGCAGAVGVRVLHYESQLFPTNPDEWFTGNDILIRFECEYEILEGPGEFKIEGYNECDTYPHAPIVHFNVLRRELPYPATTGWVEG